MFDKGSYKKLGGQLLTHGVEYQTLILCRLILFCTVEDFHADVDVPHVRKLHCSH